MHTYKKITSSGGCKWAAIICRNFAKGRPTRGAREDDVVSHAYMYVCTGGRCGLPCTCKPSLKHLDDDFRKF